jgi:hypothetical protein
VDQQVGAIAQLEHSRRHLEAAVERLLVVAHVHDRVAAVLDPVSESGTDVGHEPRHDADVADGELGVGHRMEAQLAGQVGDAHREVRRRHELVERLLEGQALGRRRVDVERRARPQRGSEEGQALDVVPVQVGDERVAVERLVGREAVAPEPETGAEVEDDGGRARRLDADARGVAAVATVGVT